MAPLVLDPLVPPNVIIVKHGKPVRLTYHREESVAYSKMVVFGDFGKSAKLPQGETVAMEFVTDKPGEYEFSCQMRMYLGKLIVE